MGCGPPSIKVKLRQFFFGPFIFTAAATTSTKT